MKQKLGKILVIGLCFLGLFTLRVRGDYEDASQLVEVGELEEAVQDYGLGEVEGVDLEDGLSSLLLQANDALWSVVKDALKSGALLLVIVVLCSLASGTYEGIKWTGNLDVIPMVGAIAITGVAVTDVNGLIGMGREVLYSMETFSKVLLPTLATATAASGMAAGAVARQVATVFFSDILLSLIDGLLLPLVYLYIGACVAHGALGNEGFKRIAALLKWVITTTLTSIMLAFVAYLSLSGVVAGSTDALAVKATKLAISGMVPVVGGILSDATETVLVGAGFLKQSIGIFGLLGVLSMCLIPFLQLGVHYLTYKVTAALSATVAEGRVAGLIDSIGGAFGIVLGMTGASAFLLLVSIVSAISAVSV